MSIKALSLTAVRPYQSKFDSAKGTADATTFRLGTLDSRIMGMVKDMATSFVVNPSAPDDQVETSINRNDVNFNLVAYGLRGWENYKDEKGNDIAFKTQTRRHGGSSYTVVDPDILKTIPQAVIEELAEEISRDNEVSAEEGNA